MSDETTGAVRTAGPDRHPEPQPAKVLERSDSAVSALAPADQEKLGDLDVRPEFATPEGLRALLDRLAEAGPGSWAASPEATALLAYCADRYVHLARKHHASGHDAAVAAFEALRSVSVRRSRNPWAVVTTAVARTLRAEARADDLLCSRDRARRLMARTDLPPAWRIGNPSAPTPTPGTEPAPWLELALATTRSDLAGACDLDPATALVVGQVRAATRTTVAVLVAVGWPNDVARLGLEHITTTLTSAGGVPTARERLRKDRQPATALDIDQPTWTRLVSAVLGTPTRNGLLHRLLAGDTAHQVITDDAHDLTPPRHVDQREAGHAA
ncbi:hypothetical protein APR04_005502 [Promicromonospora umidemergens]|uniref:Uncharacterized protein n=1 Tax=Promicromonospora umidemergens TaxID=629679 RepID=A0ABP8WE66_9MICO|nr:hypothetical protein [Promicromonospora umidemergens]MCP2286564.1 hypothetical protein [Promicromonospora umidemergens]